MLSVLWLLGRTIIAYYAVQFVPPLVLGAAYFLSAEKIPLWFVILILCGSVTWFVLFVLNPTHITFTLDSPSI